MKNKVFKIITAMLLVIPGYAQDADQAELAPIEKIIEGVNTSLYNANYALNDSDVEIKTAKVSLKTAQSTTTGGGFKIFIKASKKVQWNNSSSITYSYTQPPGLANKKKPNKDFNEILTNVIVQTAKDWKKSNNINGLEKSEFTVELSFGLEKNGEGGFEFELWSIAFEAGGKRAKTAVHTITLTFASTS